MKRLMLALAVATSLVPALAEAQRWGAYGPAVQAQGPMKKGEPAGGHDRRGERPPQRDERHQGRMTDEERRGLHQDLDRANREIYKPAPKR